GTSNRKVRKYSADYLKFGIIWSSSEDELRPMCVLCHEVLANESLKPTNLRHHLTQKHGEYESKTLDFFQNKLTEFKESKKIMMIMVTGSDNTRAMEASYWVAQLIAKTGKPHTIGEELTLPAAKTIVNTMPGERAWKQISLIPLLNNIVQHRIEEMAENVREQLMNRVHQSRFNALQMDETTDIANLAQLLVFVRYEHSGEVKDLLFCKPLPTHTTAEAIFDMLNCFIVGNNIDWKNVLGLAKGAHGMTGQYCGVVTHIKSVAPYATSIQRSIHCEALATKKIPAALKSALYESVKVNYIKAHPFNSRLFAVLCDEMGSDHCQLLLHTEVCWLSRGKVLMRIFEMDIKFELAHCFHDFNWLAILAYLADVFGHLNGLNLNLQEKAVTHFQVQDKIETMIKKLELWSSQIDQSNYDSFSNLSDFLITSEMQLLSYVKHTIRVHLQSLKTHLEEYF
uniref:BED-type domain-containing protein n=1 Tax=Pelodiscus sinensis TaxID=13735 RepID=K7FJU0_PELSI